MKRLIIVLIIIVLISIPVYLVLNTQKSQDDFYTQLNEFSLLLNEHKYEQAKLIYEESSNTLKANYNISLDGYAHTLVENSKKQDSTQEALDLLYAFKQIGYSSAEIDDSILYYEDLLQSNYIFLNGVEFYNNNEFIKAMECFADVLEYDQNYQQAQEYLAGYKKDILWWKEAKENNLYGRSPFPNSIAYQDNFIYIPYKFDDAEAILKINVVTDNIFSFPILFNKNGAEISDFNIVGDYIFFLVKQESLMSDNADKNTVYRISTDGEDLVKITDCDYTYLISHQDRFYAISKSKGIISTDNYFLEETVLADSDDEIISMQLTDDGIFYTTHDETDRINTEYFYDGKTSDEVMHEQNMYYYDYGDDNIIYYDSNDFYEYMYHENMSTGTANNNQIFAGDIYKYYGRLNDSVIFTVLGDYQQECIRVRDIKKFKTTYKAPTSEISYVPMGICYEAGWILLKSDDGISLTTENMRIQQSISLPHLNNSVLTENEEQITLVENYFSSEATSTIQDDKWFYSDENVSISTEKKYLEYVESIIYVSHIYTADYKWLDMKQLEKSEVIADTAENIIWGMSGQSYNAEPVMIDENSGTLKTDAYTYNDDGMFLAYRSDNMVSAETLLSNNIIYVFAQGDIILDNYKITNDCLQDNGYLSGRSAIGMVEPGHYVAVVAENSSKTNRGLSLYTLARELKEERCISAYSFDYGYSPFVLMLDDYLYSPLIKPDEANEYSEILYYIGE